MPIKKENEVKEKDGLGMDRVRHGIDISNDIAADPKTVDEKKTSSSEP